MGTDNPVEVRHALPAWDVHRRLHPLVRRVPVRKRAEDVAEPPEVFCLVLQRQAALANLVFLRLGVGHDGGPEELCNTGMADLGEDTQLRDCELRGLSYLNNVPAPDRCIPTATVGAYVAIMGMCFLVGIERGPNPDRHEVAVRVEIQHASERHDCSQASFL